MQPLRGKPRRSEANSVDAAQTLLALYPAVFNDSEGGIYASFGVDGLHFWSRGELLTPSPVSLSRTFDHPAGVIEQDDGSRSVLILRDVDTSERAWSERPPWEKGSVWCHCMPRYRPTLCRYEIPQKVLWPVVGRSDRADAYSTGRKR